MARVLLVMPRLPQRMGTPYLGQLYTAAALGRAGHQVRCLDLSAPYWRGGDEMAVQEASRFGPDLVGLTLFTYSAARGYRLARALRETTRLVLAGGPHPTLCPEEPVRHGCDLALAGESELRILAIARMLDEGASLSEVAGLHGRGAAGLPSEPIGDLDALPFPHEAYGCFDMTWYDPSGRTLAPGGIMSSRGCPARCTFCANYVTGRVFRYRSAGNVVAEMRELRERYDITHFPFWDDAFTANRPRLNALTDAITAEPDLEGTTWSCITPANMVKPFDLARMRKAGCVAINFGIESADPTVLKLIQKGQRPEKVRDAVEAAKAEGMTTVVNFMFGFPGEGVAELRHTLDFMEELATSTDYFNTRGVLVPFPGTAVYDRHAAAYGLSEWWLDESKVAIEPDFATAEEAQRYAETDPTLSLDFFRYPDAVRDQIAACVRFKARHNQETLARLLRRAAA
jgi:radical SAM superfamily enzyme YgiQ (UPF0313 family)